MESLNIDCLIEILKFLNLKDQLALYQVNSCLQHATGALWRIKYKNVKINFLDMTLDAGELKIFFNCIMDVVETMQLRFLNQLQYEAMKAFIFVKLKTFRFTQKKPYFMQDKDLKDLRVMMPNLQALSPHGSFSGQYMTEWSTLKELNLGFCFKMEMQHFEAIMRHLKLEKLNMNIFPSNNQFEQMSLQEAQVDYIKYIRLNTYELYYILSKPLKALKELIITNHYNPRQLFDVLLSNWLATDIRRIETANVDNILVNCLEMHMNVEQLFIINDAYALPGHIIPSLNMLTDLRILRFRNCELLKKDFTNLLKNTIQLDEVSCENCQFDVDQIGLNVLEIVEKRTKKLRLNMWENRLMDNMDLQVWLRNQEGIHVTVALIGAHCLLELTHLQGEDLSYEPLYVLYR